MAPGSQKELYFFDVHWEDTFDDADVARYHSYFPRPPGCITGEWTPDYMFHVWVPPLLQRAAPQARILVCLRDPIARYLSDLRLWVTLGLDPDNLGRVSDLAQSRSYYAYHLLRLLKYFPREQLLVLQQERCAQEPESQLRRTYEFLGVADVDFLPADIGRPVNTTPMDVDIPRPLMLAPDESFRRDAELLLEIEPDLDLSLWPGTG